MQTTRSLSRRDQWRFAASYIENNVINLLKSNRTVAASPRIGGAKKSPASKSRMKRGGNIFPRASCATLMTDLFFPLCFSRWSKALEPTSFAYSATRTASRFSSTSCPGSFFFSCCLLWWRPFHGRPPVPACRTYTGTPPIQCEFTGLP